MEGIMEKDIHGRYWAGVESTFDGSFQFVEDHGSYRVIRKPRTVITLDLIQQCKTCHKEMSNCIMDHVRREHPEVDQ
jgi:hypothetical protein